MSEKPTVLFISTGKSADDSLVAEGLAASWGSKFKFPSDGMNKIVIGWDTKAETQGDLQAEVLKAAMKNRIVFIGYDDGIDRGFMYKLQLTAENESNRTIGFGELRLGKVFATSSDAEDASHLLGESGEYLFRDRTSSMAMLIRHAEPQDLNFEQPIITALRAA